MKTRILIIILIITSVILMAAVFYVQKNDSETEAYTGKNCNMLGYPDVDCFVDSFNSCTLAMIEETHNTIEGDPVTITATINPNANKNRCGIDLLHDTTQDRFGKTGVFHYVCFDIDVDEYHLRFTQCDSVPKDGNKYGFQIQRTP